MELKFDDKEEEKYIASYLLQDQLFFLKVSKYLVTKDWTKKQYFQDPKIQFILNTAIKYQENYKTPATTQALHLITNRAIKDDEALNKAIHEKLDELLAIPKGAVSEQYHQERTVKFIQTTRAVEATMLNQ